MIRDVADTKMRAWKKQMASLPRHRQLEAERMQVFSDADHGDFQVTHLMLLMSSTCSIVHIEILAQTYLISFPAEHTAADEDQEEENLRLCNILQVQKAS